MTLPQQTNTGRTRPPFLARMVTVGLAVGGAVAAWAFATYALGIDVRSPEMGDDAVADITVAQVVVVGLVASLAGWALLAGLERFTRRARRIWGVAAGAALVLSLGAPLTGEGIDGTERATLVALHLVVAAVLIPGMLRTTTDRARPNPAPAEHDEMGAA